MIKRVLSLMIAILIFGAFSVCAFAHDVPDYNRRGSITINLVYDGKPVSGGFLTIFKVADVVPDKGDYVFAFTEDFAECPIPVTELNSSELPEALAEIAKEKDLEGTTKMVDSNGYVRFEDLEIGLYLVVQYRPAAGFNAISPFLVSVPGLDDGIYIYDVDASPKVELEPKPDEPPEKPEKKPDDELPDTGLTNWPIPVMAVSGAVLICAGIILRRFERKNK